MADVEITVRTNGPYLVKGPIQVVDGDGNEIDLGGRAAVSFCRCGTSSNKPFCDGNHNRIGFDGTLAAKS